MAKKSLRQKKAAQLSSAGQKQKLGQVKGRELPRGGVPEVSIPPLDAQPMTDPQTGQPMTMQQQAFALRDPTNPLSPFYDPQKALLAQQVQGDQMDPQKRRQMRPQQPPSPPQPQQPQQPATGGAQTPFGPTLPPEAEKQPGFIQGVGSRYAVNQPTLQRQASAGGKPPISPQTAEGLKALAEFQQTVQEVQSDPGKDETGRKTEEFDDPEGLRKAMESVGMNEQFFSDLREQTNRYNLADTKLRDQIEKRCSPMNVADLLMDGELRQEVPIVRDQLVVTYRTVSGAEDLEVKRLIYGVVGSDQYVADLISFYSLTCGLFAINGEPLPDHLDNERRFNKDLFLRKFERIRSFALALIGSLSVNYAWFEDRARGLFYDVDAVKNGL